MGWFGRRDRDEDVDDAVGAEPDEQPVLEIGDDVVDDDRPVRPLARRLGESERDRIAAGLAELQTAGVDVDDLASLGAALDADLAGWLAVPEAQRAGHDRIVERFAIGIGEHLSRHTDLDWQVVTDVFGTDLAVAGGQRGDFVVVPSNLVASRWMRRESGWLPGVVGHLVRRRQR